MIKLDMQYYYKGSSNICLTLVQRTNYDIDIVTDYNETIASVQTGYGLMRVLQDLMEDKYA